MYVCMYEWINLCIMYVLRFHTCMYVYVCKYVCMYVCMYVCVYVCVYVQCMQVHVGRYVGFSGRWVSVGIGTCMQEGHLLFIYFCCGSVEKTTDPQPWCPRMNLLAAACSALGQGTLSLLPSPSGRTYSLKIERIFTPCMRSDFSDHFFWKWISSEQDKIPLVE